MREENKKIKYISLQEASKLCEYSQEYLSLRARQGKLKAVKTGRDWFTTEEQLKDYIAKANRYGKKKKSADDIFISSAEAARIVPYSAEYLSLRMRQGKLRAKKIGRSWRTKKEWLEEYVRSVKNAEMIKEAKEKRRWNCLAPSEISSSGFFVPFEQAVKNLDKKLSKSGIWEIRRENALRYWKRKRAIIESFLNLAVLKLRALEKELQVWQVSPALVSPSFRRRVRVFQMVVLAVCLAGAGSVLARPDTAGNVGRFFSGTLSRGAEAVFEMAEAPKRFVVYLENSPAGLKNELLTGGAVLKNGVAQAGRPLKDFGRELWQQFLSAKKEMKTGLALAGSAPEGLKNIFIRCGDNLADLPERAKELVIWSGEKFDRLGGFLQSEMENGFFAAQTNIVQWPERIKNFYLNLDRQNESAKIGVNQFFSRLGLKIYSWIDSAADRLANLPFSIYDQYDKLSRRAGKAIVDAGQGVKNKISSPTAPGNIGRAILDSLDEAGGLINRPLTAANRALAASKESMTQSIAGLFDFYARHLTQYGQLAENINSLFGKNIAGAPWIAPAAGDYQSSEDFWQLSQEVEELRSEIIEMQLSFSASSPEAVQQTINNYNGPVTLYETNNSVQNIYQSLPVGNYVTQNDLVNLKAELLANIGNAQQASASYVTNNFYSWASSQRIDSLGAVTINGLQWPTDKGTNGQYLMTDGSAALHWRTIDLSRAGGWVHEGNVVHLQNATDLVGIGTSTPTVSLFIDATDAIKIPVGTTLERPANITGLIRFNTTTRQFEGYNGIAWAGLGGVMDVDQDTYIIPESTPGADEDILFFYTAGAERARISSTGNFGIGTTSPFAKLTVEGDAYFAGNLTVSSLTATSSITAPYFTATAANATSTFTGGFSAASSLYVLQNGKVGIGTVAPTAKLDIKDGNLAFSQTGLSQPFTSYADGTNYGLVNVYGGTWGGMVITGLTGNNPSSVGLSLNGYVGATSVTEGGIVFNAQKASGASRVALGESDVAFRFKTSSKDLMTILGGGNVGLGTTSPYALFSLQATAGGQTPLFTIASSTNGAATSTYLIVSANGNTAIGTTNTSLGKLQIDGRGGTGLYVKGGDSGAGRTIANFVDYNEVSALYVRGNRNVGIGTAAPSGLLSIRDALPSNITSITGAPTLSVSSDPSANENFVMASYGNNVFGNAIMGFKTRSATIAGGTIVQDGDNLWRIEGYGDDGSAYRKAAGIRFQVDGIPGANDMPGRIVFFTQPDGSGGEPTEKMRITSTGNVGVGSTSPYAKLSVTSTGSGPSFLVEDSASPDTTPFIIDASGNVGIGTTTPRAKLHIEDQNPSIRIQDTDDGRPGLITMDNSVLSIWASSAFSETGDITFRVGAGGGSETMRIKNGNVGIGTTEPQTKLHISGASPIIRLTDSDGGGEYAQISGNSLSGSLSLQADEGNGAANSAILFKVDGSERARITSVGNLGIKTSNPAVALDVDGSVRLTGGLGVGVLNEVPGTLVTTAGATIGGSLNIADVITVSGIGTSTFTGPIAILTAENPGLKIGDNNIGYIKIGGSTIYDDLVDLTLDSDTTQVNIPDNLYLSGNLLLQGGAILGSDSADDIVFNGLVNSNIVPKTTATFALGSDLLRWKEIWTANLYTETTNISNSTSSNFVINSDNGTADMEDSQLEFERGSVNPNAIIKWDSTAQRFDFNMPIYAQQYIQIAGSTATSTFTGAVVIESTSNPGLQLGNGISGIMQIGGSQMYDSSGDLTLDSDTGTVSLAAGDSLTVPGILTVQSTLATSTFAGPLTVMTDKLVVQQSSGNVGIGTTDPQALLHVNGTFLANQTATFEAGVQIDDTLNVDGNFTINTNVVEIDSISGNITTIGTGWFKTDLKVDGNSTTTGRQYVGSDLTVSGGGFFSGGLSISGSLSAIGNISTDGVFLASDGSAALPSYSFSNDSNTGLFRPGDDILAFSTGGSERIRIDNAGNVGIGTTTTEQRLSISGGFMQTPINPVLVSGVKSGTGPIYSIVTSGKYAFIGTYDATVGSEDFQVYDISNPANPTRVGGVDLGSNAVYSVYVSGKYVYLGLYNITTDANDFVIYDISNISNLTYVGGVNLQDTTKKVNSIYVSGKYAYLATENAAVNSEDFQVYDISNPANPTRVGGVDVSINAVNSVYVSGKYAYIGTQGGIVGSYDFQIYDISDPINPVLIGGSDLNDSANYPVQSIYVSGKYAYLGTLSAGPSRDQELVIYDISNPIVPAYIGGANVDSTLRVYSVFVSGKYAYIGIRDADYNGEDVQIYDISNPANPYRVAGVNAFSNEIVYSISVAGKYLYVGSRDSVIGNFRIYDISGIDSPSATVGALAAGTLNIWENASVNNNLYVVGGINVGLGGLYSGGETQIYASSTRAALTVTATSTSDITGPIASFLAGTSEVMRLTSAGNLGIGTTSPWGLLSINSNGLAIGAPQFVVGSSTRTDLIVTQAGNVGIGTDTPTSLLSLKSASANQIMIAYDDTTYGTIGVDSSGSMTLAGNSGAGGNVIIDVNTNLGIGTDTPASTLTIQAAAGVSPLHIVNSAGSSLMYMNSAGNLGIGGIPYGGRLTIIAFGMTSATHSMNVLSSDQQLNNFWLRDDGAGYLRAAGWTYGSDARMKENISYFDGGLDKILQLSPARFDYIGGQNNQLGFIAQDVQSVIPEAVTVTDPATGMLGLKTDFILPYLVNAIKELSASSSPLFSGISIASDISTTTPFMNVGEFSNVGIGIDPSTSSGNKLAVGGDIVATGFVNVSTRDAKTGIEYLSSEDYESILEKITGAKVATYYYNGENENDPRRLGLIAEEAPREVLSVDGKGVDLYKLASFTLAGVKELAGKFDNFKLEVNSLEARVEVLEQSNISNISDNFNNSLETLTGETIELSPSSIAALSNHLYSSILEAFRNLGLAFEQGIVKIQKLVVGALQVNKLTVNTTLYDTNNPDAEKLDPTIGSAEINQGESYTYIMNNQITDSAKIFVTPEMPVALGVCERHSQAEMVDNPSTGGQVVERPQGFMVCMNGTSTEPVKFNWWIVETISDDGIFPSTTLGTGDDQFPISNQNQNPNDQTMNNQASGPSETLSSSPSPSPTPFESPEPSASPGPTESASPSPSASPEPSPSESPSVSPEANPNENGQ